MVIRKGLAQSQSFHYHPAVRVSAGHTASSKEALMPFPARDVYGDQDDHTCPTVMRMPPGASSDQEVNLGLHLRLAVKRW